MSGLVDPSFDSKPGRAARGGRSVDRAQAIHQGVVTAILEHRLLPGTKLGEDDLGQIYGVSRTIVRAALQSLAREVSSSSKRIAARSSPAPPPKTPAKSLRRAR
ncbi:GntR family transcriptional regulator [Elstera litoralis]|uniref:GntR family transcriptional regulator n=1 Tax=Elstera litoralis TaxID=552518 RepID=UPI000AB9D668